MKESRLYSFLDQKNHFSMHLLEGQQMLDEINEIHNIGEFAQAFYQKILLTTNQMSVFLKPKESLGIYIDSEAPYFRFKIEIGDTGKYRTLLLPEDFEQFPSHVSGFIRVVKSYPNKTPYTSTIEVKNADIDQIVNKILEISYQTNSKVITSNNQNKSIMITKLPKPNVNKNFDHETEISLDDYILRNSLLIQNELASTPKEIEEIVTQMESYAMSYLHSKEVKFHCPCSKQNMVNNLKKLGPDDTQEIFSEKDSVEVRCDYCNTVYEIKKKEI